MTRGRPIDLVLGLDQRLQEHLTVAPVVELVAAGYDPSLVDRVVRLVDLAEYKRRQTPLGVRVSHKAFGKDRRMPITNRYAGSGGSPGGSPPS